MPRPTFLLEAPAPVKILAYADDLLVFLSHHQELDLLLIILDVYSQASNGRINLHKTVAVSLSGAPLTQWTDCFDRAGITARHDSQSATALRYLGFPLSSHPSQLQTFSQQILCKLDQLVTFHSPRKLSIAGKSLILNSLPLSRL